SHRPGASLDLRPTRTPPRRRSAPSSCRSPRFPRTSSLGALGGPFSRLPPVVAAARTRAVPSMMYTGTLMTETVFYPVFVCVALALVLMLERPTVARQLVLLPLAVRAFATRPQAVVLIPGVG